MTSFLSPQFVIGSIRIGTVQNASCVNMGNNWPAGFESHQKLTQGFGSVSGDRNVVSGARSLLNDADFVDMLNLSDSEAPDWLKHLILNSGESAGQVAEPEIGPLPD